MKRELVRKLLWFTAAALLVLRCAPVQAAVGDPPSQPDLTDAAANVARRIREVSQLVIWPAGSPRAGQAPQFGVLGADPFSLAVTKALEEIAGSEPKREVVRSDKPADLAKCQVVFAYNPTQGRFDDLVALTEGRPVVTILFSKDRFAQGAMIELFETPSGLRYFINHPQFRRAKISPTPSLLEIALKGRPR